MKLQFTVNKIRNIKFSDGFIFGTVIFFALFLRISYLDNRPLHTDEAVHAVKFGDLLENGNYIYDPIEYHGPTLNYFTLVTTYLSGIDNLKDVSEYTLRLVPVIISLLLIFSLLLLRNHLHYKIILITALFLALSPLFVFYSRYYIQEVLLVSFTYSTLISFYKYLSSRKVIWIFISGIFTALIFATKETSIITFGAAGFTIFIILAFNRSLIHIFKIKLFHLFIFILSGIFVAILFYSSFFTNFKGVTDSILTFTNYFSKAGSNIDHSKPIYYYLQLLLTTSNSLMIFTQIPILLFSLIGIYFSFFNKHYIKSKSFIRFVSIFSITQFIVYSIIPYKTPWLILNFWIGFLIVAAYGIYILYTNFDNQNSKIFMVILVFIISGFNLYQTYLTSFKYSFRSENPFTYSQPTDDILLLSNLITDVANSNKENNDTYVYVVSTNNDYWPLPWYLRHLNNVAWNSNIKHSIYQFPIIVSTPDLENEIINNLYNNPPAGEKNLYVPLSDKYLSIRPGIEIRGYVQKRFYDYYLRTLSDNTEIKE